MVNNMEQLFKDKRVGDDKKKDKKIDNLFRQIGQLTYELDWVKKKRELSYDERAKLIDKHNPRISIRRQCVLLSISKSSTYYDHGLSDDDLKIMNLIDEIYTKWPFY